MDGGRFDVRFENKWYTSVAPGTNLVRTAHYEDPNIEKILLAKIENVKDPNIAKILAKIEIVKTKIETKIDNAVTELKSYILRHTR